VVGLAECQATCTANATCLSISFKASSSRCRLSSARTSAGGSNLKTSKDYDAYEKTKTGLAAFGTTSAAGAPLCGKLVLTHHCSVLPYYPEHPREKGVPDHNGVNNDDSNSSALLRLPPWCAGVGGNPGCTDGFGPPQVCPLFFL